MGYEENWLQLTSFSETIEWVYVDLVVKALVHYIPLSVDQLEYDPFQIWRDA